MTIPTDVLITTALIEGIVVVLLALAVLGHAIGQARSRRADERRLARAWPVLIAAISAPDAAPAVGPELSALPARLQERIVLSVARSVSGRQGERLAVVADELGLRASARRRARSWFWWRRLHGAHVLEYVFSDDPAVLRLLADRHPAVRAEAVYWAGLVLDDDLADRLVPVLADPSRLCRQAATDALLQGGSAAGPSIERRLRDRDDPSWLPLLRIAGLRPDPRYEAAARVAAGEPDPVVRAAAARLVSALGFPGAPEVLVTLLGDPDADVRAAAATGLGHLGHWPAAPDVAACLRDRTWDVRRAAGEALTHLGAPGRVLLRHYAGDSDAFAADMATRVARTTELSEARGAA